MKIDISKDILYVILLVFTLLFGMIFVSSYNPANIPNPGHPADEILIAVHGQEKLLQAAIDQGDIGLWDKVGNDFQGYFDGNLGINTDAPIHKVDVNGKITMIQETTDADVDAIVVTKGYMESKISTGSCPPGQFVNSLQEGSITCYG